MRVSRFRRRERRVGSAQLENGPQTKYQPKGAAWEIELYREGEVPRNVASAYVDPFDGHVMLLDICDVPCPR